MNDLSTPQLSKESGPPSLHVGCGTNPDHKFHVITVSPGPRTNAKGTRLAFWSPSSTAGVVELFIHALRGIAPSLEAWWSPHVWKNDHRGAGRWEAASILVVDIDYCGLPVIDGAAGTPKPSHTAPPDDVRVQLEDAVRNGAVPGNVFHHTPRGARVAFVLDAPIVERSAYDHAIGDAIQLVQRALEEQGIASRPTAEGHFIDGYQVDIAASDLARMFYTPNAIVDGRQRDAEVIRVQETPFSAHDLSFTSESDPVGAESASTAPGAHPDSGFEQAAADWNAGHATDWGAPGKGTCPACGHHDCFGRLPQMPEKWSCHSARHREDGHGCGLQRDSCWIGDALDLEAYFTGLCRTDILKRDGVWPPPGTGQPESAEPAPAQRPVIVVRPELANVADEAEAALLADKSAAIYCRAGLLMRIKRHSGGLRAGLEREPESPVIEMLPVEALREQLDRSASWVRYDGRAQELVPAMPPMWVPTTIASRAAWGFPRLKGVLEAPTMRVDGSVLDVTGYDPAAELVLLPATQFPAIPSAPYRADAHAALAVLMKPFLEFPFEAESDLSAAIAATLSLVCREAVDGCVPMFVVRAPAPATGKSLLVDVISIIGTGRAAARMTMPRSESEFRKVVHAIALEGAPSVLLDNVEGSLGSGTLAAALTATHWEDRLLGVTKRARAPLRAVWFATGNGLTFKRDLGRRVIPIDLDAKAEHPEDRNDFAHPDLRRWTIERRGELVVAAITVLRAFHLADRPCDGTKGAGSFEDWHALIRGACLWVGLADPCAGVERIRRDDDSDLANLGLALQAWLAAFEDAPALAAEAVSRAAQSPSLRDALIALQGNDKLDAASLGYVLRRVKGRPVAGLRFERVGEGRAGTRWIVRATSGEAR